MLLYCVIILEVITRDYEPCKPHPSAALHVCKVWGLSPDQVAIIGDDLTDMLCGVRAGTACECWREGGRDTRGEREGGTHMERGREGHTWREGGRDTRGEREGGTHVERGREGHTCGSVQSLHSHVVCMSIILLT